MKMVFPEYPVAHSLPVKQLIPSRLQMGQFPDIQIEDIHHRHSWMVVKFWQTYIRERRQEMHNSSTHTGSAVSNHCARTCTLAWMITRKAELQHPATFFFLFALALLSSLSSLWQAPEVLAPHPSSLLSYQWWPFHIVFSPHPFYNGKALGYQVGFSHISTP